VPAVTITSTFEAISSPMRASAENAPPTTC
jgi:hypothetical protein